MAVAGLTTMLVLLGVAPAGAAHNDLFAASEDLGALPASVAHSSAGATPNQSGEPAPCGAIDRTVWYRFTASGAGTVVADTIGGTDFDSVLAVYTGGSLGGLTTVACNDDVDEELSLQSRVVFSVTPGTTYRIQLGGFFGATGAYRLDVCELVVPPTAPLDLTAEPSASGSIGSVDVAWEAPASAGPCAAGLISYEVERDGGVIGTTKTTSFTDFGRPLLSNNTYRVRAVQAGQPGPQAGPVCSKPYPWLAELGCV